MNKEIMNIKVESIFPNTYQPRKFFNEEALNELSQSIIEHGIIQPITVRRMGDKFELVAGERRWRAARMAELEFVPCNVIDITDTTFTINTYRTDTEEKIDETFSIAKVNESDNKNQTDNTQTDNKKQPTTAKKNTTKPAEKAVAPKKAVVKRVKSLGKKKIKITVKKSSKQVSGYEVILSTKKNFKNAKKITTKKNVITVKKLKAGKKYFVKVRAFKKVGNKKIYGNYSTVKKVIVKK